MLSSIQIIATIMLLQAFGVSPSTIQIVKTELSAPITQSISNSLPAITTPIQQSVGATEPIQSTSTTCIDNNPTLLFSSATTTGGQVGGYLNFYASYYSTCPIDPNILVTTRWNNAISTTTLEDWTQISPTEFTRYWPYGVFHSPLTVILTVGITTQTISINSN